MNMLYEWQTRGNQNCAICAALHGKRQTRDQWEATIQPGFHPGCDCILLPVCDTAGSSSLDFTCQSAALRCTRLRAVRPRVVPIDVHIQRIWIR